MNFHAFRQQSLPAALAPARESGAAAFRAHAGAKTVLVFPGPFRALECSFHGVKSGYVRGVSPPVNRRAADLLIVIVLVLLLVIDLSAIRLRARARDCQRQYFME
jgi:hypothetical protein